MDGGRLARNTRVLTRMEKTYKFNLDVCYQFYFDKDEKPANYTPSETTAQPTTKSVNRNADKSVEPGFWSLYLVPVIAGIAAFVVVACFITVCCLCAAKRERKKRKVIEGEYKIVASTLTNITDSEDGCTYETLSMRDPTYNHGLKLPTRKQKGKIKGVTNPFSAMRRLLSEDGESTGSTDTTITYTTDYKRAQPLPAIPEAINNKDTVKAIDDYTEIGSDSVKDRARNEYHHLASSKRMQMDYVDGNPYDALRHSQILKYESDAKATGEYFVLESNNIDTNVAEAPTINQSDGYFCLEKVNRVNSESGLCKTNSQGVIIPTESVRALENNSEPRLSTENAERDPNVNSEIVISVNSEPKNPNTKSQQVEVSNRLSNTYFTLAKESDSNAKPTQTSLPSNEYLDLENAAGNSNRTSYLEASELQKHNYVDLVADFSHGQKTKVGSIPAYAQVKK